MIPVVGMFRGLFLGSVLVWYSSSVWKTMDNYYNQEFKKYLQKEKQERRFPSEEEVCRALPEQPCASAAAATTSQGAVTDAGGCDEDGVRDEDVVTRDAEALDASAVPGSGATGGGGGGCTVSRDVTHTGEWRRREGEGESGSSADRRHAGDDGDTCPAPN